MNEQNKQLKRGGDRREGGERTDRRGMANELFPGEEITHEDIGLKEDRREGSRRTGKDRRD